MTKQHLDDTAANFILQAVVAEGHVLQPHVVRWHGAVLMKTLQMPIPLSQAVKEMEHGPLVGSAFPWCSCIYIYIYGFLYNLISIRWGCSASKFSSRVRLTQRLEVESSQSVEDSRLCMSVH